ncbi:MAG: hypothetical protein HC871_11245 [Rhizobiales bacterium]|nr:hypothetical protein [Hyphomicrobiales bacterium]
MVQLTAYTLDTFLAPKMSSFRSADIPDMSGKKTPWLNKFSLNNILRGRYTGQQVHQYVFNYVHCVEAAHLEYENARTATADYLKGSRQSIEMYMKALYHWRAFLGQCGLALDLHAKLCRMGRPKRGIKGPPEERMYVLYQTSKHVADRIEKREYLTPDATIPIWMEDEGLRSVKCAVTWSECATVLDELSDIATQLEDPRTARERIEAAMAAEKAPGPAAPPRFEDPARRGSPASLGAAES